MQNSQALASLSVLTSFHDKRRNILDAFFPLIEYGLSMISEKDSQHCDVESLKELIEYNTGIKINTLSLKSLLKRLDRNGIIRLMEKKQYFQILNYNKLKNNEYAQSIEKFNRDCRKFVHEYIRHSNDARPEEEIFDWIYQFICLYWGNLEVSTREIKNIKEIGMEYNSFLKFLDYINNYDSALLETFVGIYFGYNMCSILNNSVHDLPNAKINELVVFLDSNFILRLLDLQAENYTAETKELFNILKANKASIRVYQQTLEEIKSVLLYYQKIYVKQGDNLKKCFDSPELINGVLGAYFRRNLSNSAIDNLIISLENIITDLGIQIDNLDSFSTSIKEENIYELYKKKYFDDEEDVTSDYRLKKCENYLRIIEAIATLRKKIKCNPICLGNSKYIFLTCDWRLYKYNKSISQKFNRYPEIIPQEIMANDLLLFDEQDFGKVSIKLLVSLYNTSNYLNINIIDDLCQILVEVEKESPNTATYIFKATRNSEFYSELNDIFEDEEDNIAQLKELGERIRQQEEREQEKQQQVVTSQQSIIHQKDVEIANNKVSIEELSLGLANAEKKIDKLNDFKRDLILEQLRKYKYTLRFWSIFIAIIYALATTAYVVISSYDLIKIQSGFLKVFIIVFLIITNAVTIGSSVLSIVKNKWFEKLYKKKESALIAKYEL